MVSSEEDFKIKEEEQLLGIRLLRETREKQEAKQRARQKAEEARNKKPDSFGKKVKVAVFWVLGLVATCLIVYIAIRVAIMILRLMFVPDPPWYYD